MRKRTGALIAVFIFFLFFATSVLAKSSYVLPYPSSMPGSSFYKPRLLLVSLLQYWYFGNFGSFSYNLKQSDKYLVEAKTLFEYNQYLLAYNALKKSDEYFKRTLPNLENARREGKDITQNRTILSAASEKHIEILAILSSQVPEKFIWQPEKDPASVLEIKSAIESSIALRSKNL